VTDAALPDGNAWAGHNQPPLKFGSDEHKRVFCRMLLDTFDPYKPAVIDWPVLSDDARQRITTLPIWDIAVQTEGKAGLRVKTYAALIDDPLLREATELNAFEESRHKRVLSHLVEAYGITLAPEPEYKVPRDPEWAFMVTGFSECIDSFFAFGLFEHAKRSGFFPEELVDTFEPVVREESRHILYFVNWVEWRRATMPVWQRPLFELRVMAVWIFLAWERVGIAGDLDGGPKQDNSFTVNGASHVGAAIDLAGLLDVCLSENDRRLGLYDPRLRRPSFVPTMARLARLFLRPAKAVA
jgi:hypothetical protein